jgi:hypothetical protein
MTELLREGIARADREEFIEEEEMDARIARMLNSPLLAHRTREKWGTRQALRHRTVDSIDSLSCTERHGSPFHSRAGSVFIPNRQPCRYGYRATGEGCRLALLERDA